MSAAAYGLHYLAVNNDKRILITKPPPCVRSSDRIHYVFLQNLRQRLSPHVQCRERKRVDSNVVVLVGRAGFGAFSAKPVRGIPVRPIGPIRFSPKCALPITGLPQHRFHVIFLLFSVARRSRKTGVPNRSPVSNRCPGE